MADSDDGVTAGAGPAPPPEVAGSGAPARADSGAETGVAGALADVRARRVEQRRRRQRAIRRRRVVAVVLVGGLGAGAVATADRLATPSLDARGPSGDTPIGRADARTIVVAVEDADPDETRWTLDGRPVTPTAGPDGALVYRPGPLDDGEHVVEISQAGPLGRTARRTFRFTVDTAAPVVKLAGPAVGRPGITAAVRGTVEDGTTLTVAGRPVPVRDGRFELAVPPPPAKPTVLVATDVAGNTSRWRVPLHVGVRRPGAPLRGVHVTARAWADPTLRAGVMRLIAERRINTVQLDLKDEAGLLGWQSGVPLARQAGAEERVFDLAAAVRTLHAKGIRVVGRLVCFADPQLAAHAWRAGRRAQVVQTPSGAPYAKYGGFTNPADPAVRRYNAQIAVAAARAGVDDVLLDYVRRPDGPRSSMVFRGLTVTPERMIVSFLAELRAALEPTGTFLGASVFGVAATRPTEVAQDIPAMARQVDYIAPMVYPSHWGPGEYDVADPNGNPYDITRRSLADFATKVRGTGARVVPWLQDFSLGRTYGPAEVRAQIRAAADAGAPEFLLWDAGVTYTAAAMTPDAPAGATRNVAPQAPKGVKAIVRLPDPAPRAAAPDPAPAVAVAEDTRPVPPGTEPNELGVIPVLMHHEVKPDRVGVYDQTPAEFRAELETLWKDGYTAVRASDLVTGNLDLPAGRTPVVMTFDDSTRTQFALDARGRVVPTTAVGIMLEFARTHPGFRPTGTFYINREPFGGVARPDRLLRKLVELGFELGNHTDDHVPLDRKDDGGVQAALVRGQRIITRAVPGYRVRTMALPLGVLPRRPVLAVRGSWDGTRYGPYAVLLVGAGPAPSPFARTFDPRAIPRIRSSHQPWDGSADFSAAYWLRELRRTPGRRYVSDGDPDRISHPPAAAAELAPAFRDRARAS